MMPTKVTKYLITTDNHFGHSRIIEYGRPEDYMDRIKNGFEVLNDEDVMINLGDFCIGRDAHWHEEILSWMPGTKILVRGNHDHKSTSWYMKHGWDFVCDSLSLNYGGKRILFSHKPKQISHSFDLNVHGHFHTMDRPERVSEFEGVYNKEYHKLISLENNGYKLTDLQTLIY